MEWVKLGDIATFINGYAFKPNEWTDEGVPIIRIQNLTNKEAQFNYTNKAVDKKFLVCDGDILISWSATLGIYEWDRGTAALNQHIFKVLFNKIDINKQYFKYMVEEALKRSIQYAHGSTMKHLTKSTFDNILLPVPDREVQLEITSLLYEIRNLIAKRQEQIEALDDLVESVFYDLIFDNTNEKVKLGNLLSEFIAGKSLAGTGPSEYRVLKTSCVYSGYFDEDEWKFLPEDYKPKNEHIIKNGDLLVSRMNTEELVGASAYVTKDYEDLTIPDRLWILRTNEQVSPIFLWKFFQTQYYRSLINKIATGTSGSMKNISKKNFSELKIPLPPIALQNLFDDNVRSIEEEKEKLKASLEELETLFDALMQEAFSGNLV